jgi:hypothetical protein
LLIAPNKWRLAMYNDISIAELCRKKRERWFTLERREGDSGSLSRAFGFPAGTDRAPHPEVVSAAQGGFLCERRPAKCGKRFRGYQFRLKRDTDATAIAAAIAEQGDELAQPWADTKVELSLAHPEVSISDKGYPMIQFSVEKLARDALDRMMADAISRAISGARESVHEIIGHAVGDAAKWGKERAESVERDAYDRGFKAGKKSALESLRALLMET